MRRKQVTNKNSFAKWVAVQFFHVNLKFHNSGPELKTIPEGRLVRMTCKDQCISHYNSLLLFRMKSSAKLNMHQRQNNGYWETGRRWKTAREWKTERQRREWRDRSADRVVVEEEEGGGESAWVAGRPGPEFTVCSPTQILFLFRVLPLPAYSQSDSALLSPIGPRCLEALRVPLLVESWTPRVKLLPF